MEGIVEERNKKEITPNLRRDLGDDLACGRNPWRVTVHIL